MGNAYFKDISRTIRKNSKRFLSILTITALGVAVLTGIYATCQDMYYSSDRFYDEQKLFDLRVRSTLGLTEDDVTTLQKVDGVLVADGGYSEFVHTDVNDARKTAEVIVLSARGLNQPYLTDGRLPERQDEIAVTQKFIDASNKMIGDTIVIEPDSDNESATEKDEVSIEPETFADDKDDDTINWDSEDFESDVEIDESSSALEATTFTITGIVIDPMSINNNEVSGFRTNNSSDYTFFIHQTAVDTEIYTSVYLLLRELGELNCFSDKYEQASAEIVSYIENEIQKQREKARYEVVMQEAHEKISDAEDTMREKFAETDEKFADAWAEIEDARLELIDGEATLTKEEQDALLKLDDARKELEDGKLELLDAERELIDGQLEIEENEQKIKDGWKELNDEKVKAEDAFKEAEETFAEKKDELKENRRTLDDGVTKLRQMFGVQWPEAEWDALLAASALKTAELLAGNPQISQSELSTQVALTTRAEQSVVNAKIPSSDMAKQVLQAGMGLGMLQASSQLLDEQARLIADSMAIVEAQIVNLDGLISQIDIQSPMSKVQPWPQEQWNGLVAAAAQKAAALLAVTPQMDSVDLALQVFAETISEQTDLATELQGSGLEDLITQAGVNWGMLTGSKQVAVAQRDALLQAERQISVKKQELSVTLAQTQAGVDQIKLLFGNDWPRSEWSAVVSAASRETVKQLKKDNEIDPDDLQWIVEEEIVSQTDELRDSVPAALSDNVSEAAVGLGILQGSRKYLDEQELEYWSEKADALQKMEEARLELIDGEEKLADGKRELEDGKIKIEDGWAELEDGEATLIEEERKALKEIADAWAEIADGKQEFYDGEIELIDNERKYQDKKTEAEQKLADAYAKLDDIDMTRWYVQDRGSIDSYSSLKSDLSSIQAVGTAFPIVFLLVAVLISLTTMTRMVEEERGLVGTYKALGFTNFEIYAKYLSYAMFSSLMGGILGDFLGFIALPAFLFQIFRMLYILPDLLFRFDVLYGVGGALLFIVSIVGSTYLTCRKELLHTPASLMRPKSPRAGSRVLLERIPFIWNHMKFLNKVTARNIFRYKKRMLMTVTGIMGCTALVLCGFAIRDSVTDLEPKQYERTYKYDLMAVANKDDENLLFDYLNGQNEISDFIVTQLETVKIYNKDGISESVQMFVIPTGASLEPYISTMTKDGTAVELNDDGVFLTRNAAEILGIKEQDEIIIQTLMLDRCNTTLSRIVENYLGNHIFISEKLYNSLLGDLKPNAALAHFADSVQNHAALTERILEYDFVMSTISTQVMKDEFSGNFAIVNAVVYLLTVLAAGLAFVVLFTLSGTNISERQRELATIKVLGFYDNEVHTYVNKETLILTFLGVLLGLPAGRMVSGLLTQALKMPGLYFAVYVDPISYLISGLISFSFALFVNLITNRILDKINMVEALKSVE